MLRETGDQTANIFSESLAKEVKYVPVSEDDASKGMKVMGMPDWLIEALLEFSRVIRKDNLAPVTQTFEELTGNKPIPFAQFAKDFSNMFK